jgi:hypothetical protein
LVFLVFPSHDIPLPIYRWSSSSAAGAWKPQGELIRQEKWASSDRRIDAEGDLYCGRRFHQNE